MAVISRNDFEKKFAQVFDRVGLATLCRENEMAEYLEDAMILLEYNLFGYCEYIMPLDKIKLTKSKITKTDK